MTLSMRLWRAIRHTATRFGWFALGFLANLAMAVYASKGNGRAKLVAEPDGKGPAVVAQLPVRATKDPYAYGGPEWAGDGCSGRPINLGLFPDKGQPAPRTSLAWPSSTSGAR